VMRVLRSEQVRGYVMYYAPENPRTAVRVVGADGEWSVPAFLDTGLGCQLTKLSIS
jgi:hypothetical protein